MGIGKKKKRADEKAWADWLSDEVPEPQAGAPASAPVQSAARTSGRPTGYQNLVRQQPQLGSQQPPPARVHQPIFRQSPQPTAADPQLPWEPQARERTKVHPPSQPAEQSSKVRKASALPTQPAPAVSISIQIPSFSREQVRYARQRLSKQAGKLLASMVANKRRLAIAGSVAGLIVLGLVVPPIVRFGQQQAAKKHAATIAATNAAELGYAKPSFQVVVPSTEPNLATPDGKHSAYDAKRQSYSFIDNIGGKQFTVSEQQLPNGQTANAVVQAAAKSVNAVTPLQTGWGTAYIQTNQKYNSQTIVFSLKGVLVFIQSSFVLTNTQWTTYINAMN